MLKILVADDHPLMRRALTLTISETVERAEVTEVGDGDAVLAACRSAPWDLVILDVVMPGRSGIEVLEQLRALRPEIPVLMVSALPESAYAVRALRLGAAGFVSKASAVADLGVAVRRILSGGRYVSPSLGEALAHAVVDGVDNDAHGGVSAREFDVLVRLARGEQVGGIARALHLSAKTVSTYRSRIYLKLHLASNADATLYALRHGLIEPVPTA